MSISGDSQAVTDAAGALSDLLERLAPLYDQKEALAMDVKALNREIDEIEQQAVEMLVASGLEGVRCAGKSWFLRDEFMVSIPSAKREEAVRAAAAAGIGEEVVSVVTTTLKSWLIERWRSGGKATMTLAEGTPFDGIVSEFRTRKLSRQTRG